VNREPLDSVPLWVLFLAACTLTGLALEGGYRLGKWRHARAPEEKEASVGEMVGSMLALLAFLLGFTFGLAASRWESRREAVLEEANAIGTTYLRTQLLPEPQRAETARLLRDYVDTRLLDMRQGTASEMIANAIARSEELHEQLWSQAVAAAQKSPTPITGLFIQSLNETIDMHAKRMMVGTRGRIPISIWAGLFGLAMLGLAGVGYHAGLSTTRRSPAMFAMVLAFAGVIFLIADLDRPYEGFLTVTQQPLMDLQRSMGQGK
jgi:hypothetical protein